MKALSMPVSSPSRAEKFPPPLTRFLKGNVGSRSRGRSRASPMFYNRSKKNASGVNIETTQEPSSPKVTCIGQVRVRRSAKSKPKSTARTGQVTSDRRPCWWLKKPLFCCRIFPRFCSQRNFCGPLSRWALFFRSSYCNKVDAREDSFRVNSNQKCQTNENCVAGVNNSNSSSNSNSDSEVDGGIKYENLETLVPRKKKDLIFSPPKNALILTRCRSAPYRSSSLAARIWGSPFESSETQGVKTENEAKPEQESQNPTSQNVMEESRTTPEISKELGKTEKNVEELQGIAGVGNAIHPLLLTRSKSEPARTGERLNPECNLSSPTRLADVEQCSRHNS